MAFLFAPEQLYHVLFLLLRVSALLLAVPLFGGPGVPPHVKIGLAGLTALLLVPVVPAGLPPTDLLDVLTTSAQEIGVGLGMGFVVSLFFFGLQLAGQLMDVPIGYGMVNVLDPHFGGQVPILGQFQNALAVLVFFTINGHHELFRALADSYALIPIGQAAWHDGLAAVIIQGVTSMFLLGVRIGVPVMAAAFLTDVALGIVNRAVPQINVFITGYPLKIAAGLFTIIIVLPVYVSLLALAFGDRGDMFRTVYEFLLTF